MKKLGEELNYENMSSAEYWEKATEYAVLGRDLSLYQLQRAGLDHRIALKRKEIGPGVKFLRTDKARLFNESMMAWGLKGKIYERRAAAAAAAGAVETEESSILKSFIPVYTPPPPRSDAEAAFAAYNFRIDTIEDQGLQDPRAKMQDPRARWYRVRYEDFMWDIFQARYNMECSFALVPLFAAQNNGEVDTALFGTTTTTSSSSNNGILLPVSIARQFDTGMLAVVPDISDANPADDAAKWMCTTPREYKVKSYDIETQHESGCKIVDLCALRWADQSNRSYRELDGWKLTFPSCGSRNRSGECYLFFHYCVQVLRRAWKGLPAGEEMFVSDWGAVGKYVDREQMRAVIDELGCEPESLMSCAGEGIGSGAGDRYVLLEALAEHVIVSNQRYMSRDELYGDEEDEGSSDEDDDDGYYPWISE